jgi:hypothetical protein
MSVRIHHFGYVVRSIEDYLKQSVWELRGPIVTDPLQKARLCMVGVPGDDGRHLVELIEPVGEHSPVYRASQQSQGWHHVCLALSTKVEAEELMRGQRMLPVTPWKPAALFEMREVRFVYTRNRELVELIIDETAS